MKKIFSLAVVLLLTFTLGIAFSVPIKASYSDQENAVTIHPTEQDIQDLINGESVLINDENGLDFYILVPVNEYETEIAFDWVNAIRIAFEVVNLVLDSCDILDIYFSWNPCESVKNQLLTAVNRKPGKYKYLVAREYINPPSKPGCQPMHSYQCNTPGYYIYSFKKV